MSDRTVHATSPQMEVVRYDRAGKWYLEPTNPDLKRQAVNLKDAVAYARWLQEGEGVVHFGLSGGSSFDRAVRYD